MVFDGQEISYLKVTNNYRFVMKENTIMNRQTLIQNILTNYGKFITEETIIPLIDSGIEQGLSYDLIYLGLKMELCKLAGEEFYCTSSDMTRAFNMSDEEINERIKEARQELAAEGKNPNDYFREVKATRFMI